METIIHAQIWAQSSFTDVKVDGGLNGSLLIRSISSKKHSSQAAILACLYDSQKKEHNEKVEQFTSPIMTSGGAVR